MLAFLLFLIGLNNAPDGGGPVIETCAFLPVGTPCPPPPPPPPTCDNGGWGQGFELCEPI